VFRKVLIANRGEIAVRIARACRELGASPVAVFSEADREALHVRLSDEAVLVGPAPSSESYLNIERVLAAAKTTGAEAIHPGYGFLSENPAFAQAVQDAGLTWIGPSPQAIQSMGDKVEARRLAEAAGVPLVPGTPGPVTSVEEAKKAADAFGYPVLLKAAAGGGGKGMRRVDSPDGLASALETARSEARSAFGNDAVYVEKYITSPRHIEIQVLADGTGRTLHLFERECSIQRRHQKVVEEAPSAVLDEKTRQQMAEVAVRLAREIGYVSAGTVEFLYDDTDGKFYFLEMNTRLQVEHPVTEAITGIDLVKAMLRIADGQELPFEQEQIMRRGHALECRIYAEDPAKNFRPSPGLLSVYRPPGGPGVRVDGGVYAGYTVPTAYDPMIAKLITFGLSRQAAIRRMTRALREFTVRGIATTLPLFQKIMADPGFNRGEMTTHYLDDTNFAEGGPSAESVNAALLTAAIVAFQTDRDARALPGTTDEHVGSDPGRSGGSWRWYNHRKGFGRS
jgi:acetyl-CoA carboxylase biotin carboxylase subunit